MSARKMAVRFLAPMVLLALCIGFLPMQAHAWTGPVKGKDTAATVNTAVKQGNRTVAQLKNDYITFEVDTTDNSTCRTVPTKYYSGTLSGSVSKNIYQDLVFSVKYKNKSEQRLTPKKITASKGAAEAGDEGKLILEYEFAEYTAPVKVSFSIIEVTEGVYDGSFEFPVTLESYNAAKTDEHGKTYLVTAHAEFESNASTPQGTVFMNLVSHRMPFFGHEGESAPKRVVASQCNTYNDYPGERTAKLASLSSGLSKTYVGDFDSESPYNEVGTVSYDEANPFVLLESGYAVNDSPFVDGFFYGIDATVDPKHRDSLLQLPAGGEYLSYTPPQSDGIASASYDVLTVWSLRGNGDIGFNDTGDATQTWGFRNLYKQGETVVPIGDASAVTDSEFEDSPTSAAKLAIVPDGKKFKVKEIAEGKSAPNDAVAVISGTFAYSGRQGENHYDFTEGTVYLSPTISANFDPSKGGYFHLKPDGTIEARGISLSMPSFCFYKPKGAAGGKEPVFSYDKAKGLVATLDPGNNKSFVKVNVPYAQSAIEAAAIDKNGGIVLSGAVGFKTIFEGAQFKLERLSYGTKGNEFKLNGMKATLDIEDVNLFGLEVDKAKGEVDTFTPYYNFELAVNAFDIFAFEADLELMKAKDGALVPNKLYGELATSVGIPLVPPAPIAELNGGGVGFDDLVETINGDYIAIPPVKLTLTAVGSVVKLVGGKLSATLGATGFDIAGTDLKIPAVNGKKFVDEMGLHLWIEGMKRTDEDVVYTGINVNGGVNIKAGFMDSGTWKNVIGVDGALDVNAFGGTGKRSGKNELYLLFDATGKVRGALKFPEDWKVIGGKEVLSAELLASLGLTTHVPLGTGSTSKVFTSALKNVKGYLGLCATINICGVYGQIIYKSPSTIDGGVYFSKPKDVNFSALSGQSDDSHQFVAMGLCNKDGEQVGIAVVESGLKAQNSEIVTQGDGHQITAQLPAGASVAGKTAILDVKLAEGTTASLEDLIAGLAIDGKQAVEIEIDEKGNNDNGGNVVVNYKVREKQDGELERTDEIDSVSLFLDSAKSSWTVTSANAKLVCDDDSFLVSDPNDFEALENVALTAGEGNNKVLAGKAVNLDPQKSYEIHVYMGSDKDAGEAAVVEPIPVQLAAGATEFSFDDVVVPLSGEALSSGDYYVSVALVETDSIDGDGNGEITEDEKVQVALARWNAEDTVHYTNTNTPATPESVTVAQAGNETLSCTFSTVDNADGYRVRILKRGEGADFEDTGFGYEFALENGTLTCAGSSAAIEESGGSYKVMLAPTVGGKAIEGADELQTLQPGDGYKLAVSAYRNVGKLSIDDPETGTTQETDYKVYSSEALSGETAITSYAPAEFTVKVNGEGVAADVETGLYDAVVPPSRRDLEIAVTSEGSYEIDVVRETAEGADASMADELHADGATLSGELKAFEGSAMYDIVITNTATQDKTRAFLQVSVDEVPPTLLLDADVFEADANGRYTVSGTTEPNVRVNGGDPVGEDGRFEVSGEMTEQYGTLKRKMMRVLRTPVEETQNFDSEDDFNGSIEFMDEQKAMGMLAWFEVEPSTWSGASVDYKVSYQWQQLEMYSEANYDDYLGEADTESIDIYYEEEQLSGEELEKAQSSLIEECEEIVDRGTQVAVGTLSLDVMAEDESGNQALATATVTSHIHQLEPVAEVPATCTQAGTAAHYHCTACGNDFSDELGATPAGDLTIPIDKDNHAYGDWSVTKPATEKAEGQEARTCTRCGNVETRSIAKLKPNPNPKKATIKLVVGNIAVDKKTVPLKTKQKLTKITAKMNSGDKLAKVQSANSKIVQASISGNKVVLKAAKKTGKSKITVTTKAGAQTFFTVNVQKKKVVATKIVGFKKKLALQKGKTFKISMDVFPVSAPDKLKFKTSNKKVAVVSSKGAITAKGKGKATITATVGKKTFKCKVTVK